MPRTAFERRLAAIAGTAHVLDDPEVCASYGRDTTGRFGRPAAVVVRPGSTREVAEVLAAAGTRVDTAHSAEEALCHLAADPPSVLVTDLGMPHVDGFQLLEQVRAHRDPAVRQLPVAALTAYARSEDRVKAMRAGFQIHLAKPIDPVELIATIAGLTKRFKPAVPDGD